MVYLAIDYSRCRDCGTCEKCLKGFKSEHKGTLMISNNRYDNDINVNLSCKSIVHSCPQSAVSIIRK